MAPQAERIRSPERRSVSDARETDPLPEVGRHLASGTERLMASVWPILQTSVAASIAYFLAAFVLGNEQPFFAPVAAVVTLGLAPGERGRRAVEVAVGVVVGLAVADVIIRAIGVGAAQIGWWWGWRWRRPCSSGRGPSW